MTVDRSRQPTSPTSYYDWWDLGPLLGGTTVIEDDEEPSLSPILGPDGSPLGRPPVRQGFMGFVQLRYRK